MGVAEKIERKINRMQEGVTFQYQQLGIDRDEYSAAAKAIERFLKRGLIRKISIGMFYKPKQSAFGRLRPREEELLKPYLFQGGKRIAYITGSLLYNRMGLTTQVPKTITVASRVKRITTKIGTLRVKPVKSYINVTNDNYYLLEILDALKDFKSITDIDKKSAITILENKIDELPEKELSRLIKYALQYPPRARALLGAILSTLRKDEKNGRLKTSLNPLTIYDIGIEENILPTAPDWNIK